MATQIVTHTKHLFAVEFKEDVGITYVLAEDFTEVQEHIGNSCVGKSIEKIYIDRYDCIYKVDVQKC